MGKEAVGVGSDQLSTNAKQVIERSIEIEESKDIGEYSFEEYFEIGETAQIIEKNNHKIVALQFPDELLWAANRVQKLISEKCQSDVKICILADTSFGSCCVDYVAADHFNATIIVHYGHACLSYFTNRISVFYVFTKKKYEKKIEEFFEEHFIQFNDNHENFLIFYDSPYHHELNTMNFLKNKINENFGENKKIQICEIEKKYFEEEKKGKKEQTQGNCEEPENCECKNTNSEEKIKILENKGEKILFGRKLNHKIQKIHKNFGIIWIGDVESITLRNLKMRFNANKFYIWNPQDSSFIQEKVLTRSLMQRFGLMEKAKEANLIGIIIGSVAVSNYLEILEYLKKIIKNAGKSFYIYVIGKLNPYKLANFPEVDIFVLISCHENSAIDSREFYRPVITPFELQLALVRFVNLFLFFPFSFLSHIRFAPLE